MVCCSRRLRLLCLPTNRLTRVTRRPVWPATTTIPGRQQAGEVGAQCGSGAGSGAFGYFGKGNNLAGGANGTQTGLNNSAVCGNRQGNLP